MKKRNLAFLVVLSLQLLFTNAQAQNNAFKKAGGNKTFSTSEFHYAACPSPAEELNFTWDAKTGKVSSFYWNHGGVTWFMYTNTPVESTVILDPKTSYYYNVDLYVTTKNYETTAYKITAKLTINALRPNGATLGGLYEGTGTAWLGANGTITGN